MIFTSLRPALIALVLVTVGSVVAMRVADRRPASSAEPSVRYRFVVAPGGDPSAIHLDFSNADIVEIDRSGDLLLRNQKSGPVHRPRPAAYQDIKGRRRQVDLHFAMDERGDVKLVAGGYDTTQPLVIDPLTSFFTGAR